MGWFGFKGAKAPLLLHPLPGLVSQGLEEETGGVNWQLGLYFGGGGGWRGVEQGECREGTVLELAFRLCLVALSCGVLLQTRWQLLSLYPAGSQSMPLTWPVSGIEIRILAPQNKGVLGTRVCNSPCEEALADVLHLTLSQELSGACVPWPTSWGLRCASWRDSASQGSGKMPRSYSSASLSQTLR